LEIAGRLRCGREKRCPALWGCSVKCRGKGKAKKNEKKESATSLRNLDAGERVTWLRRSIGGRAVSYPCG